MTNGDDRMTALERRLDAIGDDVRGLKDDVRGLKQDVRGLRDDVRGLRVLHEHHDDHIRTIAEVQAHHGRLLEDHGRLLREIKDDLGPLRDLHDFVRRVTENHESRITTLEKHTGIQ